MTKHDQNLDSLMELDNITNILDARSGRTSLNFLINKYPKATIDAIVVPGDHRTIKSIQKNVSGKYHLKELDLFNIEMNKGYDLVLAHLLLGEAKMSENKLEEFIEKLLSIHSKCFVIYDLKEDLSINYKYLEKYLRENDFQIMHFKTFETKEQPNYVAYVIRRLELTDIVYEYINQFIKNDVLITKLENLTLDLYSNKQQLDIKQLIEHIKNMLEEKRTAEEIAQVLTKNKTYLEMATTMNAKGLLLMISRYISAPSIPNINQDFFDEMVDIGIKYDKKEALWRLAFNYANAHKNFSKIVDYYLKTKSSWYLSELLYAVENNINTEEFIQKIIYSKDKQLIKRIYDDHKDSGILDESNLELLKRDLAEN